VPQITDEVPFGGAIEKITRLGLTPLHDELRQILTGFLTPNPDGRRLTGATA
jgi:hypothetical protein